MKIDFLDMKDVTAFSEVQARVCFSALHLQPIIIFRMS